MIKSKFYLIRGDGEPIYVGFTNRPIKQRFAEHKADKDFSDYENVTIEKIDELDYEFTWNEDILYKNANEVSEREAQLVKKYETQNSRYQKAVGGGVVWSYEKYFVRTNKDNPKFVGMSNTTTEIYIQEKKKQKDRISKLIHSKSDITKSKYYNDYVNKSVDKMYKGLEALPKKNKIYSLAESFSSDAHIQCKIIFLLKPIEDYMLYNILCPIIMKRQTTLKDSISKRVKKDGYYEVMKQDNIEKYIKTIEKDEILKIRDIKGEETEKKIREILSFGEHKIKNKILKSGCYIKNNFKSTVDVFLGREEERLSRYIYIEKNIIESKVKKILDTGRLNDLDLLISSGSLEKWL